MRILMAPLVGAFLFSAAGCAHQGQGISPIPLSIAPPPEHHYHTTHKAPKPSKHHTAPPAVQAQPEPLPLPPETPAEPDYRPGEQPTPDLLPPTIVPQPPHATDETDPAPRESLWAKGGAALVGIAAVVAAVGLIAFFVITFIRGFLAARKGQAS